MTKLEKKRNEVAQEIATNWANDNVNGGIKVVAALGFDAALAELMPQAQKLVDAASKIRLKYEGHDDVAYIAGIAELDNCLTEWQEYVGKEN